MTLFIMDFVVFLVLSTIRTNNNYNICFILQVNENVSYERSLSLNPPNRYPSVLGVFSSSLEDISTDHFRTLRIEEDDEDVQSSSPNSISIILEV